MASMSCGTFQWCRRSDSRTANDSEASIGEPACEVGRLLDEVVHECVEPERARGRRNKGPHERFSLFGQIFPIGDLKAGSGYVAAQLFIRCEVTPLAAIGPRKGVVDRPGISLDNIDSVLCLVDC